MLRHLSGVAASALLLLSACSTQAAPLTAEVAPTPVVSASPPPVLKPDLVKPTQPAPVPTTDTDPKRLRSAEDTVPALLTVGSVDVAMDVVPVGVEPDGDMALPKTVAEAGWYQFGPRPGDASGATVLAAHVDTHAEGLGPFARLRSVKRGASVVLSTRDGAVHRYRVSSVQLVPKSEVPAAAVFDREGPPRLTLVTCGGAYDRGNGYSDNVVVTATSESGAKS